MNLNALYYSAMFQLPVTSCNNHIVKVSDITYCLPNYRARNYQKMVQRIQYKFSGSVPLQSNFIFLVDDIDINNINSFEYTQSNKVRVISVMRQIHHYQRTSGPRIIFLVKALIENKWKNYLA